MTATPDALAPGWRLRPFRAGDDETFVRLWQAVLDRDPLSLPAFRRQTLLDPGFDPAGCLLAEATEAAAPGEAAEPAHGVAAGRITGDAVGFVLAAAPRRRDRFSAGIARGRIVGLGVLPAARRRGLGAALLGAAMTFLRARGCTGVSVAAHEYYAAGVDREAYGEGMAFLTRHGFEEKGQAVAMGRELYHLEWPPAVREAASRLSAAGIVVRPFRAADAYPLATYFRAEFPGWQEFFTRKLDAGHDRQEMIVAVDGGAPGAGAGAVVGYCQHLDADHVGPFGVAASYRGRGIGTVMLYRLLEGMRQRGFKFAWFGETGRAQPYYERVGFHVTRRYALLERDL